jgi:hypothetical protein
MLIIISAIKARPRVSVQHPQSAAAFPLNYIYYHFNKARLKTITPLCAHEASGKCSPITRGNIVLGKWLKHESWALGFGGVRGGYFVSKEGIPRASAEQRPAQIHLISAIKGVVHIIQ